MTRRAVARSRVAARLVALTGAFAITALEGQATTASVLALAMSAAILIAQTIPSTSAGSLALEVTLTAVALTLASTPFSPVFLALPLIALWDLQARSQRLTALAGAVLVGTTWISAAYVWDQTSILSIIIASLAALTIMLLPPGSPARTSARHDAYDLIASVRDLNTLERDPSRVASEFLEDLLPLSGTDRLLLETTTGEVLASIGPEWNLEQSGRQPLTLHDRTIAVLRSPQPLPSSAHLDETIVDHVILLATAMAFAEIQAMASDAERSRISREIHDGIAQEIASIGYAIDDLMSDAPELMRPRLRDLRQHLTAVVSDLRLSIFELRGRERGTGLGVALTDLIDRQQSNSPFAISLRLDESHGRFPRAVEDQLLRITSEALTNARRHSHAHQVWVSARLHPPVAELTIEDDGIGVTPGRKDSYGLQVMRERATQINASLTIRDRNGGGTVVYLLLSPTDIGP